MIQSVFPGERSRPMKYNENNLEWTKKIFEKVGVKLNNMKLGLILTKSGMSTTSGREVSSPEMGGQVPQGGEGCLNIGEKKKKKRK